jgi:putative ABC transport system permease protein
MFVNYLKLAFRLLLRNPFFTIINMLGLSVGFAVFFVLWQYSQNELKSDQFHKDYDQIYKLGEIRRWTDDGTTWQESIMGVSAYHLSDLIGKYTPRTEQTKFFGQQNFKAPMLGHGVEVMMSYIDEKATRNSFLETKMVYAEPNFFSFFSLSLTQGNPQNVLKYPDAVVISEATARKYFGLNDPIGKTLLLNDSIALSVTGIFKNLPHNTHLDFDIVISTERIRKQLDQLKGGERFYSYTYIKFPPQTNIEELQNKVNVFSKGEVKANYGRLPFRKSRDLFSAAKGSTL